MKNIRSAAVQRKRISTLGWKLRSGQIPIVKGTVGEYLSWFVTVEIFPFEWIFVWSGNDQNYKNTFLYLMDFELTWNFKRQSGMEGLPFETRGIRCKIEFFGEKAISIVEKDVYPSYLVWNKIPPVAGKKIFNFLWNQWKESGENATWFHAANHVALKAEHKVLMQGDVLTRR